MMTLWYEDLHVGAVFPYGTHVMDRDDMVAFATKWDPRDFHVDTTFAETTLFGSLTASGINTLAVYTKLLNQVSPDWAVRGALGYKELRFAKAVKPGDVLTGQTEILEKRLSKSLPRYGIIKICDQLTNQDGHLVLELFPSILIERAPGRENRHA